jgi:hypothetical protein
MNGDNHPKTAGTTTHESMRKTRRARMALAASGLLIAGGTLLLGPHAVAKSNENECSNRTLRGSFAFNIDGTIIAGPNRLLLRGLAMTQFDGRGNLSQVDFTTINGAPTGADWRPGVGSYELNADCTGSMEIIPGDGSPTLRLRMVVAEHGRTIHNVVEGNSTGATGTKVD